TLQSALGSKFATVSRRWRMPEQVSPESRPALFQVQTGERAKTNANGEPIVWIAAVDLVIYTQGSGDEHLRRLGGAPRRRAGPRRRGTAGEQAAGPGAGRPDRPPGGAAAGPRRR